MMKPDEDREITRDGKIYCILKSGILKNESHCYSSMIPEVMLEGPFSASLVHY